MNWERGEEAGMDRGRGGKAGMDGGINLISSNKPMNPIMRKSVSKLVFQYY